MIFKLYLIRLYLYGTNLNKIMKVWIVWNERENSNKSTAIDKIFSTEKKALEYIESVKSDHISDKYIEEFEVD